jgi:hypothetical protein
MFGINEVINWPTCFGINEVINWPTCFGINEVINWPTCLGLMHTFHIEYMDWITTYTLL